MEEQVKQQEQIQAQQQQNQEPELTNYKETQYSAKVLTLMGKLIEWSVNMVMPAFVIYSIGGKGSWAEKIFLFVIFFVAYFFLKNLIYRVGKTIFDFCCAATIKINHIHFLRKSQAVINTIFLIPFLLLFLALVQSLIAGLWNCRFLFIK